VSAKAFSIYIDNFFVGDGGIPETYKAHFERNQRLISFEYIPETIRDAILEEFSKPAPSALFARGKRTHYLVQAGVNPNNF
jgi:hypothetical protein